jgi:hypothetical protein
MVSGTVRDQRTSEPLRSVLVEAFNAATDAPMGDAVYTSSNGFYQVTGLDTVTPLRIVFTKPEYDTREVSGVYVPLMLNITLMPKAPAPPTGVDAAAGAGQVLVWWDPNREPDLAGYDVYRADGIGDIQELDFTQLNEETISATEYRDIDPSEANQYTYYVTAVDVEDRESAPSEPVLVRPDIIVVWLPQVQGEPGEEIRVPVNTKNASGISPSGIDIAVRYDPAFVEYQDYESIRVERTAITQYLDFEYYAPEPGIVYVMCTTAGDELRGEGHLFDIYFQLRDDAPQSECFPLLFESVTFFDRNANLLESDSTQSGLVCVSPLCNQGDLNSDGAPNSGDVILALKAAVDLLAPDDCQRIAADMNGDGQIDSADALMIKRLSLHQRLNPPQPGEKTLSREELPLAELLKNGEAKAVEVASDNALAGETVTVPVTLNNAEGLTGFDLEVSYPAEGQLVSLVSVEAGGLSTSFQQESNAGEGYAQVSMSTALPLQDASGTGGTLVDLTFEVSETAPAGTRLPISVSTVKMKGQYGESFDWYVGITKAPGEITVVDASVLAVTPEECQVPAAGDTTTFEVTNAGEGTMHWEAGVAADAQGWLSVESGGVGTDDGTVTLAFTSNASSESRTGEVTITAANAQGSPATVRVVQAGLPEYTLTMAVEGQGTVEPSAGPHQYISGSTVTVEATPAADWEFDHWAGSVVDSQAATTSVNVTGNLTVTAVFVQSGTDCMGATLATPRSGTNGRAGDLLLLSGVGFVLGMLGRKGRLAASRS